jgi:hypothetical protein
VDRLGAGVRLVRHDRRRQPLALAADGERHRTGPAAGALPVARTAPHRAHGGHARRGQPGHAGATGERVRGHRRRVAVHDHRVRLAGACACPRRQPRHAVPGQSAARRDEVHRPRL